MTKYKCEKCENKIEVMGKDVFVFCNCGGLMIVHNKTKREVK